MTSTGQPDMYKMKADSDVYLALRLADQYEDKDISPPGTSSIPEPLSSGNEQADNKEEIERNSPPANEEGINHHNVIWVPAHKHPEIAPNEFATWLQSQGNSPTRRMSGLSRKSSALSQSRASNDEEIENSDTLSLQRTTSSQRGELKSMIKEEESLKDVDFRSFVFDKYSTEHDDSRTILPPENRTLLRRSAFSARGRGRKAGSGGVGRSERRPNRNRDEVPKPQENAARQAIPIEGVRLYDRPVSMSEWIDLGSASLGSDDSQHGILSRVHDAETDLYYRMLSETGKPEDDAAQNDSMPVSPVDTVITTMSEPVTPDSPSSPFSEQAESPTASFTPPTTSIPTIMEETISPVNAELVSPEPNSATASRDTHILQKMERPSLRRSYSEKRAYNKSDKKSSWLVGLFNDGKKNRRVEDETKPEGEKGAGHPGQAQSTLPAPTLGKKSGLVSLITRSLSMKSSIVPSLSPVPYSAKSSALVKKRLNPEPQFRSYRMPIHVERAIYRLSHFKLAEPRRALRHQVLISNFMFWYLSIINTPATVNSVESGKENLTGNDTEKKGSRVSRLISSTKKLRDTRRDQNQEQNEAKIGKGNPTWTRPFQRSNDTPTQPPLDEDDNRPLSYFSATS